MSNLLFVDVETGGLEPRENSLLEIAIIETTRGGEFVQGYHTKIAPQKDYTIEEAAIKVNGYTPEKWAGAVRLYEAQMAIEEIWPHRDEHKRVLVGWNPEFDKKFIDVKGIWLPIKRFTLDIKAVGWFQWKHLDHPHLEDACKLFGISAEFHTAYGDANACLQLYRALGAKCGL